MRFPTLTAARVIPAAIAEARRALEQGAHGRGCKPCAMRPEPWSVCDPDNQPVLRSSPFEAHLIFGHALATTSQAEAEAAYENGVRAATDDDGRARFIAACGWMVYSHGEGSRAAHVYQRGLDLRGPSPPSERTWPQVSGGCWLARVCTSEDSVLIDSALDLGRRTGVPRDRSLRP